MSNINDGGPAFPSTMPYAPAATVGPQPTYYSSGPHTWTAPTISSPGMSLRDWIAGQALISVGQTLVAPSGATLEAVCAELARASYLVADAMLAERSKPGASS